MEITLSKKELKIALLSAYECGRIGCAELTDENINEILYSISKIVKKPLNDFSSEWEKCNFEKLKIGTNILHTDLGLGKIQKLNGQIVAVFFNGTFSLEEENVYPWNKPIKILGKEKNCY